MMVAMLSSPSIVQMFPYSLCKMIKEDEQCGKATNACIRSVSEATLTRKEVGVYHRARQSDEQSQPFWDPKVQ